MKVLIVGPGGREHALAWTLARSPSVEQVFAQPGNAGIASVATCVDGGMDAASVAKTAEHHGIDLIVIGPEAPLVDGIADDLRARGLAVFGPSAAAARIEGSKAWAKEILAKAGAPTGGARTFTDAAEAIAYLDELSPPYVVKADGLAAGKGVTVATQKPDAVRAIEECLVDSRFGGAGATVLIEEFLEGEELSLFCLTDGTTVVPLAEAQDFKRALDGDQGPNTGGMGAYSPVTHLPADTVARAVREIFEPVVATMAAEGVPYSGLLYGGLMITADGPKVFEFNCRFGDPETQVVLPRLESDLAELMLATVEGRLEGVKTSWRPEACVTVVLASGGYPGSYETGKAISGIEAAEDEDVIVFHAGTAEGPVTAGGRVLSVSALGPDLAAARARAYDAIGKIEFEGKQYRTDIAARAAERQGG